MPYSESLADCVIAISVSEGPDLAMLGMSPSHLRDATAELSRHLLALGARVAYGGDLRQGGFTEILFELVARHRRDADEGDDRPGVLSYLAFPVHLTISYEELALYAESLRGMAKLMLLGPEGDIMLLDQRRTLKSRPPSPTEWIDGLSNMRKQMVGNADGRIVAGGQVSGFRGSMPGIAEEALLTIECGKPLYVLGGFGGCARGIGTAMGLIERDDSPAPEWKNYEAFQKLDSSVLNNGLTTKENLTLARTPHIDEAVALVLRGLVKLRT